MSADGTLRFDTSLNTEGLQEGTGRLGSIAKDALGIFAGNMKGQDLTGDQGPSVGGS